MVSILLNQEIDDIDKTYSETRRALLDLDVSKAIEASKQLIDTYEKQLTKLNDEKERLETFQQKMKEMIVQEKLLCWCMVIQNGLKIITMKRYVHF